MKAELPAKFSVGFDGGETASIVHLHNEIVLGAIKQDAEVYLRLYLSVEKDRPPVDAGISLRVEECLPVAIALMEVYLEGVRLYRKKIDSSKKPRLRQILQQWGMAWYRDRVSRYLSTPHVNNKFGQLLYSNVIVDEIPALIEKIIQSNQTTANWQSLTNDRYDP